jgi:hypothetical protein
MPIFKFLLSNSNFPTSVGDADFQVSAFKFQLSNFCWRCRFSSFCFQIPTFQLLLANPIFTLLLCKLLAETNAYFQIRFTCVISAQVSSNVLGLCEEAELEVQMFNLAQKFIRIPNVQFSTEPAFLQNPCYRFVPFLVKLFFQD